MEDLTIIFLTLNKVPTKWAKYQKQVLLEAVGDTTIITLSKKPLDWGKNIIQTEPEGVSNIYWQILKGAKLATTPYIAIAEDDTLYHKEHFIYRPPLDSFGYNFTRWGIFTWGRPFYFYKPRIANGTMIAPRELVIEALEERFKKYPDGIPENKAQELGVQKTERLLGVVPRKHMIFYTYVPVVCFNHQFSCDPLQQRRRKRPHPVQAFDIPHWRKAKNIVSKFI